MSEQPRGRKPHSLGPPLWDKSLGPTPEGVSHRQFHTSLELWLIEWLFIQRGKNLQITVPDNSPSAQTGKESRSRKPEREWRTAAAFLKRERPRPNGLVSQRLLAEGAEGAPAAKLHVYFFFLLSYSHLSYFWEFGQWIQNNFHKICFGRTLR